MNIYQKQYIEIEKIQFILADEITVDEVEHSLKVYNRQFCYINNKLSDGEVGIDLPAIRVNSYLELQDGYHRIAILKYFNQKFNSNIKYICAIVKD